MKKMLKRICLSFIFFIVPYIFVLSLSYGIRGSLNKTFFSGYNNNASCNLNSSYSVGASNSVSLIRYAKVKENCFLFKTSDIIDASYRNIEFIIPASYFVTILSDVNSMIYKVQYKNKIGYVASDSVKEVDFLPINPTLDGITFDIPDNVGTQLRSSPTTEDSSNILKVIPAGTKSVSYIASTIGVVPTGGNSNIWYYVLYSPATDPTSVYEGYVYSSKTVNLSEINLNDEDVIEINDENDEDDTVFTINETVRVVLIVIICIPIVLVFILLVVSNKNKVKKNEDVYEEEYENRKERILPALKKKTINDFEGKELKRKSAIFARFVEDENTGLKQAPVFPTYEEIDDDDLL